MAPARPLLAVLVLVAAALPAGASAAEPARFSAGAAVRSVHPNEPVGPAGSTAGQVATTTNVRDPLETRALYVTNGRRATVFVATDIFGQFAAVEEGADLGLQATRELAARRVSELGGVPLRPQDIVISSSHSHATGSVQGFWHPPPVAFMHLLRDRQVEVIVAAAKAARPAHLEWATGDGERLNALVVSQVNAYEGWVPDGQVSVLRATDAATGATISTYTTIPVHPTIIPGVAFDPQVLSADYPGAVRDELDRLLGGISVVAPGTLGRQTSPWSIGHDLARAERQVDWFGVEAARIVAGALTEARPVTDDRVESAEALQETSITNGFVLALTGAHHVDGDLYGTASAGKAPWPLNRDDAPPWQDGLRLQTPLTAIRIGGLLFVSQPGEPFTEIRLAIRDGVRDAEQVVAISQAQDALGYYYPAAIAPLTLAYPVNDHALFNVAPTFGDAIIARDLGLAETLGFTTTTPGPTSPPRANAYQRAATSGIQFLASPYRGSACGGRFTPTLQAVYSPVLRHGYAAPGPKPAGGKVRWDFGDGASAETGYLFKGARGLLGTPEGGEPMIEHAFAAGRYTVTVRARDEAGGEASWSLPVVADPELRAVVEGRDEGDGVRLRVHASGGSGRMARATFTVDGRQIEGADVRVARDAGRVGVEIADTGGSIATATLRVEGGVTSVRARTCGSRPGERIDLPVAASLGLPRAACQSRRRIVVRVRPPRGERLRSAEIRVDGRRVRVLSGRRLRVSVDLRGLPRGRYRVEIVARTRTGRLLREVRTYRTCVHRAS